MVRDYWKDNEEINPLRNRQKGSSLFCKIIFKGNQEQSGTNRHSDSWMAGEQLSNHLEEDLQKLIEFEYQDLKDE